MTDVNIHELSLAIKRKLDRENLSQSRAAEECGVGKATFSRIVNAVGKPDIENIAKICDWLNMPFERFTNGMTDRVVCYENEDKLEIIIGVINCDPNVPNEDKPALIGIFAEAYKQFTRLSKL